MNEKTPANPPPPPTYNPFKDLPEPEGAAPDRVRHQVINSYSLFNNVFKIIDLYIGGFFNTLGGLLSLKPSSNQEKTNPTPEDTEDEK